MSDEAPKSAVELALERLRRKDAAEGVVQAPLTDTQKAEIGEVKNFYEAKLAELEVLHGSALARTFDPAAREEQEGNYRREREHLASERDARLARMRDRQ